ncbi:YesL family protein, partial [Ruminococcus sp.]
MSLFGNYNTPGRGVLKAPQEKKGIFKFFEVYGRHMWKLMELNLLYFVFCIPLTLMVILMLMTSNPIWLLLAIPSVLVGPATAAMTKVCRNYSQERNAFLLHDFWDSFKKNFKQGTIMGAIDIIFAIGFMVGIPMYKYWAEQNSMIYIPFVICISCLIVFFMMHFYIYLMISSTNLNMKQIIKNSFYLVSLGIKQSLWSLLASLIVIVMMYLFLPYSLFILPFWPLSFICFVTCFNCYPVIRKHVIQPYYDQRGESNP